MFICFIMRKYIAFIQSVSNKEWEVGEMLSNEINNNSNLSECLSEVFNIKSFKELIERLKMISADNLDASIIIVIYAHSDSEHLVFKDLNTPDKDFSDYINWAELDEVLNLLYKVHGPNVSIIFLSCFSSLYAQAISLPHIPIMAAEGVVSSRRAGEQLIIFFDKVCTDFDTKTAYDFMIESFPLEEEVNRDKKDRAILKLYI